MVELEAFSGPLDLLLHLLREEQLEIADIPIARIADQFLQAVHELGLNQAADYLDMASRLVRLKAQMLLPRRLGGRWLGGSPGRAGAPAAGVSADPGSGGLAGPGGRAAGRAVCPGLPAAATGAAAAAAHAQPARPAHRGRPGHCRRSPRPVLHRVVARPLDVESATRRIEDLLVDQEQIRWLDALGSGGTIVDVLSTSARTAGAGQARQSPPGAAHSLLADGDRP